eukprot:m.100601 g.100601  ORF g.100601 m.100601 type:complete len:1618 (+) comp13175_c1_seq1:241-5094(+)
MVWLHSIVFVDVNDAATDPNIEHGIKQVQQLAGQLNVPLSFVMAENVEDTVRQVASRDSGTSADTTIFVSTLFRGPAFDAVVQSAYGKQATTTSRHARMVLGLPACIHCLRTGKPLEPAYRHPVLGVPLLSYVITLSGFSQAQKVPISSLIETLGGQPSRSLTDAVTHLVAKVPVDMTAKFKCALANDNVHVVKIDWLKRIYDLSLKNQPCKVETICQETRVPPFSGCTICVTGLQRKQRDQVLQEARKGGGQYSPTLNQHCTHLLCNVQSGRKYDHAKRWGVHCVDSSWLFKSAEAGVRLDEANFPVGTDNALTPHESALHLERVASDLLDNCRIYLEPSTFAGERLKFYKQLIRRTGASFRSTLDDTVTHIIAAQCPDETLLTRLQTDGRLATIVYPEWLLASAESNQKQPTAQYHVSTTLAELPASKRGTTTRTVQSAVGDEDQSAGNTFETRATPTASSSGSIPSTSTPKPSQQVQPPKASVAQNLLSQLGLTQVTCPTLGPNSASLLNELAAIDEEDNALTPEERLRRRTERTKLFAGKKFNIEPGLASEEVMEQLTQYIIMCGGEKASTYAAADYFVAKPFDADPAVYGSLAGMNPSICVITGYWVEMCVNDVALHNPASDFLYQPHKIKRGHRSFSNAVLCFSSLDPPRQSLLCKLCDQMQIKHMDQLDGTVTCLVTARTARNGEPRRSAKITRALQRGLPVVTEDWLLISAQKGAPQDPSHFSAKVASSGKRRPGSARSGACASPVPPKSPLRLNTIDTSAALAALQTPGVQSAQRMSETPLDRVMQRHLQAAVERLKPVVPHLMGLDFVSVPNRNDASLPSQQLPVEFEPCKEFGDLVLTISSKVAHRFTELSRLGRAMGCAVNKRYISSTTHVLHEGKSSDHQRELVYAKRDRKYIVSPEWLVECHLEGKRLPELEYPPSYRKSRALAMSQAPASQSTTPMPTPRRTAAASAQRSTVQKSSQKVSPSRIDRVLKKAKSMSSMSQDEDTPPITTAMHSALPGRASPRTPRTPPRLNRHISSDERLLKKARSVKYTPDHPDLADEAEAGRAASDRGSPRTSTTVAPHSESSPGAPADALHQQQQLLDEEPRRPSNSGVSDDVVDRLNELVRYTSQTASSTLSRRKKSLRSRSRASSTHIQDASGNPSSPLPPEALSTTPAHPDQQPPGSQQGADGEAVGFPTAAEQAQRRTSDQISEDRSSKLDLQHDAHEDASRDGLSNANEEGDSDEHVHGLAGQTVPMNPDDLNFILSQTAITYNDPLRSEKMKLMTALGRQTESMDGAVIVDQPMTESEQADSGPAAVTTAGTSAASNSEDRTHTPPPPTSPIHKTRSATKSLSAQRQSTRQRRQQAHQAAVGLNLSREDSASQFVPSKLPTISPTVQEQASPVVMLSSLDEVSRQAALDTFGELNVPVWSEREFHPGTTHLIVSRPSRSEKFLSACASGAWIVKVEFIEACKKAGRLVNPKSFEWVESDAQKTDGKPHILRAAQYWREHVESQRREGLKPVGAFAGWKCLLAWEGQTLDAFERVLTAGGAQVTSNSSVPRSLRSYTHVFVRVEDCPDFAAIRDRLQHRVLKDSKLANLLCLNTEFISAHLFQQDQSPTENYALF